MKLLTEIDEMIESRHLLGHSFYVKWADGTLPEAALQGYARQYYAFESAFPRFLSALHARSERPDVRAALLENLWDEEHGSDNHAELWLRFAEALGMSRDQVIGASTNPGTDRLLETYRRAAFEGPVAAGVAAIYAYERQVPEIARAKLDGLRRHYGIVDGRGVAFFQVHGELDVAHAAAERRMVAELAEDDAGTVTVATAEALDAWWRFLDGVDTESEPAA